MKQICLSLIIFIIPIFLHGQMATEASKNEYLIGLNYSFLSAGDQSGFHFNNEYRRLLFPRSYIGLNLGFLHSAKESGILSDGVPPGYNNNIATGDWGLTTEDGAKILDLKTDQQTYIHVDVLFNYNLFKLKNLNLIISTGGSIAYLSISYLTRWELGTFYGEATGEQKIQLVYPYYSRLIDIGICAKIDLVYNLSDKFIIGIMTGINNYSKSGYRFYDIGLKSGIKF